MKYSTSCSFLAFAAADVTLFPTPRDCDRDTGRGCVTFSPLPSALLVLDDGSVRAGVSPVAFTRTHDSCLFVPRGACTDFRPEVF